MGAAHPITQPGGADFQVGSGRGARHDRGDVDRGGLRHRSHGRRAPALRQGPGPLALAVLLGHRHSAVWHCLRRAMGGCAGRQLRPHTHAGCDLCCHDRRLIDHGVCGLLPSVARRARPAGSWHGCKPHCRDYVHGRGLSICNAGAAVQPGRGFPGRGLGDGIRRQLGARRRARRLALDAGPWRRGARGAAAAGTRARRA
mmetsp:Transcript_110996/g.309103  ORF Transcript_110996/g.309103 Transcript_110996/m.309103 type:complete len:200 (+) Transcript_110996:224-823(+)